MRIMSRRDSCAWKLLLAFIWLAYLISIKVPPPRSRDLILDLCLVAAAHALVVVLALLFKHRARREAQVAFHLAARDEFIRVHESLGDRPPTRFFR